MKQWVTKGMVAAALSIAAATASAQQCQGFTDVLASDTAVCPAVEWIKNRGVTTGCTATAYCPTAFVTRAQMALFMQRLGKSLTPEVLRRHVSNNAPPAIPPADGSQGSLIRCMTPQSTSAIYPRHVVVNASFAGLATGSSVAINTFLLISDDNGASWSQVNADQVGVRTSAPVGHWATVGLTDSVSLPPGTALAPVQYTFAIGYRRDDVASPTTGEFAATRCQLTATIVNENGSASPL